MFTIPDFAEARRTGRRIAMLTCYDALSASALQESGIDAVLVGDSAAMVVHGQASTLTADIPMIETHVRAVRAGGPQLCIIADMPFLSTRRGLGAAVEDAGRLMRAGANAVKIEGLSGHEELIPHLIASGIPVMGHLGLQPQSFNHHGGYRVQGMDESVATRIAQDAHTLHELGCFSLVLECVPTELAALICSNTDIAVIGIGAGPDCTGQILVLQDMMGFGQARPPRFVRRYGRTRQHLIEAAKAYRNEVNARVFPSSTESYTAANPNRIAPIPIVIRDPAEWKSWCRDHAKRGSIGFVPTMGALHAGHRSLVERSARENDFTVVSIFVNPTQFNDPADLAKYPRTLEADLALLAPAGVDAVFLPEPETMYTDNYRYQVLEHEFSKRLCGEFRPGHFDGVLSVVLKLLMLTSAERAYFGEKDWQQYRLIRGMADAFFLDTAIVPCPTTREETGLAMSSRNTRLSDEGRVRAAAIHRVLTGAYTPEQASAELENLGFKVEYLEDLPDPDGGVRRLVAAWLEGVRLIDNTSRSSL